MSPLLIPFIATGVLSFWIRPYQNPGFKINPKYLFLFVDLLNNNFIISSSFVLLHKYCIDSKCKIPFFILLLCIWIKKERDDVDHLFLKVLFFESFIQFFIEWNLFFWEIFTHNFKPNIYRLCSIFFNHIINK